MSRILRIAASCGLVWVALPAAATPSLAIYDASGPIAEHRLGDDLWAGVAGAAPTTLYELRLEDAASQLLASELATTDSNGVLSMTLLWERSGVVGCDTGVTVNPAAWRFERFEDSELRAGETLTLTLRDLSGAPLAELAVPVYADLTTPRFYVSDAGACPRFRHGSGDGRWLSGLHLEACAVQDRTLWVVDGDLPSSAPLRDLRSAYPGGQPFAIPALWAGVPLVAIDISPLPASFGVAAEPAMGGSGLGERPSCATYASGGLQSGTQTTPVRACPPCTSG